MDEFRVGVSRDFLDADGRNVWGDIGLDALGSAGVLWRYLDRNTDELLAQDVAGLDAVIFAGPAVTRRTFDEGQPAPAVFARFGVGYDTVDLNACTEHDAVVTITPDGARRPVATATLTLLLATLHHLVVKDRLTRESRWADKTGWMGRGLTGRCIGLLGLGNTATDLVELLRPFHVDVVAYDPYRSPESAGALGVRLADVDSVMTQADAVIVMAALTAQTRHLVDARRLALMKPSAVLVNVARGPIVDENALVAALREGRIAGAGLDVFETEPPSPDNPLLTLERTVLSPHCLAWTDEMAVGNGGSAVRTVLDVLAGRVPRFVVNGAVLERPTFRERMAKLGGRL
ncbi:NAD(P)-dependent oxidoreductase [Frankia sp. Cppng1_Ct_nod]|uniref:NAD(P)-dependent oxidoreductase n=1 Tax=Frankia sp. Cppng1_Ct_nod TaxID=2897162 RepID=UPI002024ADFD|nr:NAD(P)-dependent oxidoreductase [Frankia sp. Cppng1_Ct_nod]